MNLLKRARGEIRLWFMSLVKSFFRKTQAIFRERSLLSSLFNSRSLVPIIYSLLSDWISPTCLVSVCLSSFEAFSCLVMLLLLCNEQLVKTCSPECNQWIISWSGQTNHETLDREWPELSRSMTENCALLRVHERG